MATGEYLQDFWTGETWPSRRKGGDIGWHGFPNVRLGRAQPYMRMPAKASQQPSSVSIMTIMILIIFVINVDHGTWLN